MLSIPSAGGLAVVAFLLLAKNLHGTLSRLLMKVQNSHHETEAGDCLTG